MSESTVTLQEAAPRAAQHAVAMKQEIGKALVGQDAVVEEVLIALLAGGHVLIEGVPGLGKTLLVQALAKTFAGQFARIQFTPDLMPADVVGHTWIDPTTRQFSVRKGPVFTNLLLADEINRAPAKTQAALLEVMQESQVTLEGETHTLPAPFMVLATQNPIEQEGTYALPEAQLDRFLLKVRIDFPSEQEEIALVNTVTANRVGDRLNVSAVNTLIDARVAAKLKEITANLRVDPAVLEYAVRVARATRETNGVQQGAGPRGSISLVRAARGAALLAGRDFVVPDDIKRVALPALRHRVVPAPEVEIEGGSSDDIVRGVLQRVPAPRQ
jgi:MoxR-like ATPase